MREKVLRSSKNAYLRYDNNDFLEDYTIPPGRNSFKNVKTQKC